MCKRTLHLRAIRTSERSELTQVFHQFCREASQVGVWQGRRRARPEVCFWHVEDCQPEHNAVPRPTCVDVAGIGEISRLGHGCDIPVAFGTNQNPPYDVELGTNRVGFSDPYIRRLHWKEIVLDVLYALVVLKFVWTLGLAQVAS